MLDFMKKNKILVIVISLLVILLMVLTLTGHKKNPTTKTASTSIGNPPIADNATNDDTAESLNALTQELHQVIQSNQTLQASNATLTKKNARILQNIKAEVQQNLANALQKRGQDNQLKIAKLQHQLQTVNTELTKIHQNASHQANGVYPVDGEGRKIPRSRIVRINGENLVAVPSMTGAPSDQADSVTRSSGNKNTSSSGSILPPNRTRTQHVLQKAKSIPYYTIPDGATLARSITMSTLIGRIPVNGVVKSPYPFKMIIGSDNMAANGLHIPGISGAIVQGYTVGDMLLSCVKGYITSITFVFPDGTISTTTDNAASDGGNLGFTDSLGYISTPNGNPCFHGKFYTNAPQYLMTMAALGGINAGGAAFQQAQLTHQTNAFGGITSTFTGSVGKAMLGGFAQGATEQAIDWYTAREKNSFDAVVVPAGESAVINITKQIDINYNPHGRKIYYGYRKKSWNNTSLD